MSTPIHVVELRQKRCNLRFGVGTCTATGTPKCVQTFATCQARDVFNLDGELRWYFHRSGDPVPYTADRPSADEWYGPSLPILEDVSTRPTRINLGAVRETESPFGRRSEAEVTLSDMRWRNQFGDFYADERTIDGPLGRLLLAWLGDAIAQLDMFIYTGEADDALADMTVQRFDVVNIEAPNGGAITIMGRDPLHRAMRGKAEFPRATALQLTGDIDDTQTAGITVAGREADVDDQFGNTSESYIRFGEEIIQYQGKTGSAGEWTLSNVQRGALGTTASSHAQDDSGQRCGHFANEEYWRAAYNVLSEHTSLNASLVDFSGSWSAEGSTYLNTLIGSGTYTEPSDVEEVIAEFSRDGLFTVWWDEREQLVKLLALRQPTNAPRTLDDRSDIVEANIIREPDQRMTRVALYYQRGDPTQALDEIGNYAFANLRVDGDAEGAFQADGSIRSRNYYSRLVRTDFNANIIGVVLLQRYGETPKYLDLVLGENNADLEIGDVIEVDSLDVVDLEGNAKKDNWQVIEWEEIEPKLRYRVLAQSFVLFARTGFIMENSAPDFASATDAEKLNALYITQNDGTMPDGSAGYVIQ